MHSFKGINSFGGISCSDPSSLLLSDMGHVDVLHNTEYLFPYIGTLCSIPAKANGLVQMLLVKKAFMKLPLFIALSQVLSMLTWSKSWRAHCCHRHLTIDLLLFGPQRQVAGEVQTQPQDRAVNQIAMMLAILGLGLSYYSAKQMREKVQVQPAPWHKPDQVMGSQK